MGRLVVGFGFGGAAGGNGDGLVGQYGSATQENSEKREEKRRKGGVMVEDETRGE